MKVLTTRFGELSVNKEDVIRFKEGILGFEEHKNFFIVDPNDNTLILWLQSTDTPNIAFPMIEPQIFKSDYFPVLMPSDMSSIDLEETSDARVYSILTIPADYTQMSANLKAPIVVNVKKNIGKQIVLQDNRMLVKHEMYKELKLAISSHATSDDRRRTMQTPIRTLSNQNSNPMAANEAESINPAELTNAKTAMTNSESN
ncbi:MAG: flagellar assembly protein FliW [Bacteriovoracaceae bacterium]|nr:flagellar assembly protein FliW [Bacteriovoracaceae bacterium]